jgi:tetratricopeptide (TPR) repeat protein
MKKDLVATKEEYQKSGKASLFEAGAGLRLRRSRSISSEKLSEVTDKIRAKLDEGLSSAAEKIITETLSDYSHAPESEAKLLRMLSYTFETQGNYKESLSVIEKYNDEENISHLELGTAISVLSQLAIAYNNTNDYPQAVGLLNNILEVAKEENLTECLGEIYIALSRVYRKLNEFPISRDHAEKALNYYREQGAWRGMAEAYYMIAMASHQEGTSEKAIEYFEQAIKIIGSHSAPFLLGKIYSDMSGAYWFVRRPQEGIACLEKSIRFFEQTEHKVQAAAAYNNLGLHLVTRGEWSKAESAYNQALDLATKANHAHVAGILDSLGELKILRGEFGEAQRLLEKSVALAEERKKEYYSIQSLRNLSRALLAQGKLSEAKEKAREAIQICRRIGERQIASMANLVLAEVYFEENNFAEAERELAVIEDAAEPSSDFFVLGNIQRVRGLIDAKQGDQELAVYHFNRSLTIFETAEDLYHMALAHYLIGKHSADSQPDRATKHLVSAGEIFRRLGVMPLFKETEKILETVKSAGTGKHRVNSASSQLLMLRLAEATASRELLFRELVAVLQQESRAQKIIVAEFSEQKH